MVSIYDIAKAVGVSASAVSYVLSGRAGKARISKEKQELILDAAKKMGYIPNMAARKLSLRNTPHLPEIALCWSPDQHPNFLNTFISILQDMTANGRVREMRFTILPYRNGELDRLAPVLTAGYYNGIIVPAVSDSDIKFMENADIQVPTVLLFGDIPRYHLVSVDNYRTGAEAAEIFHRHGHKRVAVMQPVYRQMSITTARRNAGFLETCEKHGMDAAVITGRPGESYSNKVEEGKALAGRMLEGKTVPAAVFIQNDLLALGALAVFCGHGIRIPEDMEVIVYGNNESLEIHSPSITTVQYPTREISGECINVMAQLLDKPGTGPVRRIVETPFIFRESCPE
ncbi:MAG TPA: LacI family DNA-binding transcriptional regulator [Clostridiales bacterium]|nr:LacI family DNA-binding transcriptional regulator [Clostridiales bacterium]